MSQEGALRRSLSGTIGGFCAFHILFGGAMALTFGLGLSSFLLFATCCLLYHAVVLLLLILFQKSFFLESSGAPLRGVNLPIFLSGVRLSSVPTVLYLLLSIRHAPRVLPVLIPVLAVIFLTDLFDGMLARRLNQRTRIGRYLDATSDYTNLILISVVYVIYQLIPVWLFVLVLVRLLSHGIGILLLYAKGGHEFLQVSLLGKASVFATMFLYGFELLELLSVPVLGDPALLAVMEYAAAAIIGVSFVQKAVFLKGAFSAVFQRRR